jgi:hypothetical protein
MEEEDFGLRFPAQWSYSGEIFMAQNHADVVHKKTTPSFKSLTGPILIFLLAVFFYVLAGKLDENPMEGQLGAFFWPKAILILLMFSCCFKILESYWAIGKGVAEVGVEAPPPEINTSKLVAMIFMTLGVVFFLEILGFPLANFLFLLLFMRIAGLKKRLPLILIPLLGTVLLLYIFVKIVYLPLPKGQWLFTDFTIFLYRVLYII